MTVFAPSVETLQKTDTAPENQTVSALAKAGLAQFVHYPDLEHSLRAIDHETSLPVEANTSLSLDREYTCMTCESTIAIEEHHVVLSGVYSYRERDGQIFDHHHVHADCFREHEILFWDDIVVLPMNKWRRNAILHRIHEAKARRQSSALAA